MWSEIITLFREFMGTGLIVIWYLLALVYLWLEEKRKHVRILFLYMPLVVLLLYFNPVFAKLVYGVVGDEIYYRILWLLPITLTIAWAGACVYGRIAGKKRLLADLAALCMAGAIAVSGSFIYSSVYFSRAENLYHMPDEVVGICDAISVPGREVMAVFPLELVQYVRQYSPTTCMPYGREMTVVRWHNQHPLRDEMEKEIIDMESLVPLTRKYGCHYVIFRPGQELSEEPEDYGWEWFGEAEGYTIYRDPEIELIIPDQ